MSCKGCEQKRLRDEGARRAYRQRLERAALAHGYELWFRDELNGEHHVLAVPLGPSHGTPEQVAASFRETGLPLPAPPNRARALQRMDRSFNEARIHPKGKRAWRITVPGQMPIELFFLEPTT